LDRGSVLEDWKDEGFECGFCSHLGDWGAGGVVVEAEVFAAERWRAAALAGGVDVAALEALFDGLYVLDLHDFSPVKVFGKVFD
jgi:hypothetical protein